MKKKNNTALYLSLTILALIWLVPIVTVFITSLKSNSDFFSGMGLLTCRRSCNGTTIRTRGARAILTAISATV